MNFADWAGPFPKKEPHLRADPIGIAGQSREPNSQAWFGSNIAKQLRGRAILSHNQIQAAVLIKISHSSSALLAVHLDPRLLARNGRKLSGAVATQQQSSPCIVTWNFRLIGKEILAQKNIFISVTVEIADIDAEGRSKLCVGGQELPVKVVCPIQEHH